MSAAPYVPRARCMKVRTWRHAVLASGISAGAKVVAIVLYEHMDWRGPTAGGNCWPSLETIAAEGGMHMATVVRGLAALDAAGFIERVRSKGGRKNASQGKSTHYFATLPQLSQSASVGDGSQLSQSASQLSQFASSNTRRMRDNQALDLPGSSPSASSSRVPTAVETRDDASLQKPAMNGDGLEPSDIPDWWVAQLEAENITDDVKLGVRAYDIGVEEDYCCEVWERVTGDRNNRHAWAGYRQRQRAADRGDQRRDDDDDDGWVGWCPRCRQLHELAEAEGLCAGCHEKDRRAAAHEEFMERIQEFMAQRRADGVDEEQLGREVDEVWRKWSQEMTP